jgi:uncharacterized protein involved in tolerance to divalent cations
MTESRYKMMVASFPDEDRAKSAARSALAERNALRARVVGSTWSLSRTGPHDVKERFEFLVLFETTQERADALSKQLSKATEHHGFASIPLDTPQGYMRWADEITGTHDR